MLTKCPECELQVSDKAVTCPHCGYPLKSISKKSTRGKSRLRLPNGFGQITELKNRNLRKPFRAMVTVGKNEFGKPIQKLLKPEAYFETYQEAYSALVEYNKNPYDLDDAITVQELYSLWSTEYFKNIKDSSKRTVTCAWSYCKSVYTMRACDVRIRHIKGCMEETDSPNIKSRIKSVFNLMFDYALEREIVEKNYARDFNIDKNIIKESEKNRKGHEKFTEDELKKLWDNVSTPIVNIILLQCYTGFRPQEIGLIKLDSVDLKNWTITSGMKTDAGTDRLVPVCKKIRPIVTKLYNLSRMLGSEYLCCSSDGSLMTYDMYSNRFENIMKDLEMEQHRPHDPRVTFTTMCKDVGMDEYAIKKIIGHAISDITEKIYTDRDPNWVITESKKLESL